MDDSSCLPAPYWSHLIRDFTAHAEGLAAQKEFGEQGVEIARRVFCAWDEFQEHGDRRRLKREVAPLKRELKALLRRGAKGKRHKRTWGFSKNLLKVWPALWTFTAVPAVEPTNNAAERGLRGAVITASSLWAANRSAASAGSSGCSRRPRPAACSDDRCLPT